MIKDVIRLKCEARLSHDKIATNLGISKDMVQKYLARAGAAQLRWDTVRDWDEARLQHALLPGSRPPSVFVEPDWARVQQDLQRKGVTLMLLWQEYAQAHPDGRTWRYTQFCEHYKAFRARLKRSMCQPASPARSCSWTTPGPRCGCARLAAPRSSSRPWAHRATPSPAPPRRRSSTTGSRA